MINKLLGIVILLFALNCKSTQQREKTTNDTMVLIGKGSLYGSGAEGIEKQNVVITTSEDWEKLLAKMNSVNNVSQSFSETKVDFSNYSLIAVFDEVETSGGYTLDIEIIEATDQIEVVVTRIFPDGIATSVMTQPYCIVKIPSTDLPIVF